MATQVHVYPTMEIRMAEYSHWTFTGKCAECDQPIHWRGRAKVKQQETYRRRCPHCKQWFIAEVRID